MFSLLISKVRKVEAWPVIGFFDAQQPSPLHPAKRPMPLARYLDVDARAHAAAGAGDELQ
ncbi:hypothetical protein VE26_05375 [Devosia chinhatensis]|uniref:Uncharacterized protein n=1 Tax=Devosia chinhatensis TaxID=429727 RepID=A0A0F5FMD7_9HYPH|nr:hypothetical protein VE26_05375 [Devosia chinhatensis]